MSNGTKHCQVSVWILTAVVFLSLVQLCFQTNEMLCSGWVDSTVVGSDFHIGTLSNADKTHRVEQQQYKKAHVKQRGYITTTKIISISIGCK